MWRVEPRRTLARCTPANTVVCTDDGYVVERSQLPVRSVDKIVVKLYISLFHWLVLGIGALPAATASADVSERWLFVPVGIGPSNDSLADAQQTASLERVLGAERQVEPNRAAAARFETLHSSEPVRVSDEQLARHLQIVGEGIRSLAFGKRAKAEQELRSIEDLTGPVRDFLQRAPERAQLLFDACALTAQLLLREKQSEPAQHQMTKCVRTWPGYQPGKAAAGARKLFDAALAQVAKEPSGMLSIAGREPGCSVRVNGIELGKSPAKLRLPIGYVRVQLECEPNNPGRIHAVAVGMGESSVRIDEKFDTAVHTQGALWLSYPDEATRATRVDADAAALGTILGASNVVLLLVDATGRVTVRARTKDVAVLPAAGDGGYPIAAVEEVVRKLVEQSPKAHASPAQFVRAQLDPTPAGMPAAAERAESDSGYRVPLGIAAAIGGAVGLGIGWALYAERYSLRSRMYFGDVDYASLDEFHELAPWLVVSAGLGSSALVASGALLLPDAEGVPTAAWVLGAVGAAIGLAGIAASAFGEHCQPRAAAPCDNFFADSLFGPLLVFHALPLMAVPAIYAVRVWSGETVELGIEGARLSVRGTF